MTDVQKTLIDTLHEDGKRKVVKVKSISGLSGASQGVESVHQEPHREIHACFLLNQRQRQLRRKKNWTVAHWSRV